VVAGPVEGGALPGIPPLVAATDEAARERPETVVRPYKPREQIGEGGMGLGFVAEQQQPVRHRHRQPRYTAAGWAEAGSGRVGDLPFRVGSGKGVGRSQKTIGLCDSRPLPPSVRALFAPNALMINGSVKRH
jgi:hypothetical protein